MMQLTIELLGFEFTFEAHYELVDKGIGHYEFWGHPGFNQEWVYELQELELCGIEDGQGNRYPLDSFPDEFIEAIKVDYWGQLQEEILSNLN
jgi:hypothetical protein